MVCSPQFLMPSIEPRLVLVVGLFGIAMLCVLRMGSGCTLIWEGFPQWIGLFFGWTTVSFDTGLVGLLRVNGCKMASCGVRWSFLCFVFYFPWMSMLDVRPSDRGGYLVCFCNAISVNPVAPSSSRGNLPHEASSRVGRPVWPEPY